MIDYIITINQQQIKKDNDCLDLAGINWDKLIFSSKFINHFKSNCFSQH